MKSILTLLFSSMIITTAFAQTQAEREEARRVILGERKTSTQKSGNSRDVILGDDRTVYGGTDRYPHRYPERYPSSTRERRINEINREYDSKVYSIRQNRTLSPSEKTRILRQLEADRRRKIDAINGIHYSKNRRYNDDDNWKSKKQKGNHYGWEKGKGSPHKGR